MQPKFYLLLINNHQTEFINKFVMEMTRNRLTHIK